MRRLVILVVLILLAGAAYWLSQRLFDWHYIVPVEAGIPAYISTFDVVPDDWTLYEGRLSSQVAEGMIVLEADSFSSLPFSTARPYWADFDLTVQASPRGGPLNNGYGIIFRLKSKGNTSPADDDYYLFLVSSDGYYQVARSVEGKQRELSTWIPSSLVNQGFDVINTLRVVAVGNGFRFFINGQPVQLCVPEASDGVSTYDERRGGCIGGAMVDTLTDSAITDGQIGVAVQSFDEPGVVVAFDNVVVMGPEDGSV